MKTSSGENFPSGVDYGAGVKLPKDFLLGAASAAHQVEGNNTNSDWWFYEQQGKVPKSGLGADHYHRYEEDFKLAQQMGLNLMRISLEWARIEPEEGKFSMVEVEHYRNVLKTMKFLGLKRMVTLWHWTLPLWVSKKGGFNNRDNVSYYVRYVKFVMEMLGEEIDFVVTINEPEMYSYLVYGGAKFPPFQKNPFKMWRLLNNLIKAHIQAYKTIKRVDNRIPVSIAKNCLAYEPYRNNILDKFLVYFSNYFSNHYSLRKIKNHIDFIGLNYYFYKTVKFKFGLQREIRTPEMRKTDMGWRIEPKGLYVLLKDLAKYNKPFFITENGLADREDILRKNFIKEHLFWITRALNEGVHVKGYCYWSLTDTFEWQDGYDPKFGLIKINFETLERQVRPSASIFKEIRQSP